MKNQFGYFHLGNKTHVVPMKMHAEHRQKVFKGVGLLKNACGVFEGGKSVNRHDTDHEPFFRQESYFQYLFGAKEPNWYGALDFGTQKSYLFIERLPESYATWMGEIHLPEYWKKVYEVDDVFYSDELCSKLESFGCEKVLIMHGVNTDSGSLLEGANFEGRDKFQLDKDILFPVVSQARVIKTKEEIEIMRFACQISAEAHVAVIKAARAGMMEYELESLFRHHVFSKGGCRHVGYNCICASGENSAILHYGHAGAPNAKEIKAGEILMFDMGGEYHCYTADISRSFPIDGKFTEDQKVIYQIVLDSQQAVMDAMKPGVAWRDMHRLADRVICEGLKKHGFLIGEIEDLMKNHISSLFFPHGLGHLLGLDTHDVGGYLDKRCKDYDEHFGNRTQEPGLKSLRFGGILKEDMVITVEPGVYFQPSILQPAFKDPVKSKFLNIPKIESFLGFGGVRIEDDVVVTATGIENLSHACPRQIDEIEALMNHS